MEAGVAILLFHKMDAIKVYKWATNIIVYVSEL